MTTATHSEAEGDHLSSSKRTSSTAQLVAKAAAEAKLNWPHRERTLSRGQRATAGQAAGAPLRTYLVDAVGAVEARSHGDDGGLHGGGGRRPAGRSARKKVAASGRCNPEASLTPRDGKQASCSRFLVARGDKTSGKVEPPPERSVSRKGKECAAKGQPARTEKQVPPRRRQAPGASAAGPDKPRRPLRNALQGRPGTTCRGREPRHTARSRTQAENLVRENNTNRRNFLLTQPSSCTPPLHQSPDGWETAVAA